MINFKNLSQQNYWDMSVQDEMADEESEKFERKLAELLGVGYEELLTTEYEVTDHIGNDDRVYEHIVRFTEDSPRSVLDKIIGLNERNEITIPIVDLAEEE
jgi:flagellar biosynthesis regulator FlbT